MPNYLVKFKANHMVFFLQILWNNCGILKWNNCFSTLQLQVRQEKALQRYDDTESEISQLLARHSNETQVLRERLRRTQERERAAERRLKDSEEQLQRSRTTIARLKKLVDQRELATRDELSSRLEEEKTRAQEAERKIKVN